MTPPSLITHVISLSLLLSTSDTQIKKRAEYLYEILRCPTCQNIPIKDSHTEVAEAMKKIILEKLKEGWSDEQIIQYFTERYGNEILLYPKSKFLNYLPFIFFFIGFGTLLLIFMIWKRREENYYSKTNE